MERRKPHEEDHRPTNLCLQLPQTFLPLIFAAWHIMYSLYYSRLLFMDSIVSFLIMKGENHFCISNSDVILL